MYKKVWFLFIYFFSIIQAAEEAQAAEQGSFIIDFAALHQELPEELTERCDELSTKNLFFKAIIHNNFDALEELCTSRQHQINEQDLLGNTPLYYAAQMPTITPMQILLKHGANPNTISCLKKADGSLYDYSMKYKPIEIALCQGNFRICFLLLQYGATVDESLIKQLHNTFPTRFLHNAATRFPERVREFLQTGIDPNIPNEIGFTPLHYATYNGPCLTPSEEFPKSNYCAVEDLLTHGALSNVCNQQGVTPLHLAADFGNLYALACLLLQGANKEIKTLPVLVTIQEEEEKEQQTYPELTALELTKCEEARKVFEMSKEQLQELVESYRLQPQE